MTTEKRTLEIQARMKDFVSKRSKAMSQAISRFSRLSRSGLERVKNTVFSVRTAFVGLAFALTAGAGNAISQNIDELGRWADKLDVNVERLSELQFAATQMGLQGDVLVEGLKTIQERMDDAARGTGTYTEHFRDLGLSVVDAGGNLRNVVEFLPDLTQAVKDAADRGQDLTLFFEDVVGGSENMLEILFQRGPEALQKFASEAQRLGLVIDEEMVAKNREWQKTLDKLQQVIGSVGREIVTTFAPALSSAADGLAEFIAANRERIVDAVKAIAAFVLDLAESTARAFVQIIGAIEQAARFFGNDLVPPSVKRELEGVRSELEAIDELLRDYSDETLNRLGQGGADQLRAERQALARRLVELEKVTSEGIADSLEQRITGVFDRLRSQDFSIDIPVTFTLDGGPLSPEELARRARGFADPLAKIPAAPEDPGGGPSRTVATNSEGRLLELQRLLAGLREPTRAVALELLEVDRQATNLRIEEILRGAGLEAGDMAERMAQAKNSANASFDELQRKIEGDFFLGFRDSADLALEAWSDFTAVGAQSAQTLIDTGLGGISAGLSSVIQGTQSAEDAAKQWGASMLSTLADVTAELAVVAALNLVLPGSGTASGGLFSALGFAKGGVMKGSMLGSMPVKTYANGGIANSPQLAVFGEGPSKAEAFVPLPDGRTIPVTLMGSGGQFGGDIHMHFHTPDAKSARELLWRERHTIFAAMRHGLVRDNPTRQSVQKVRA